MSQPHFKTYLTDRLQIKYPLIVAPMFLVSNEAMLQAAHTAGAIGCMPALNMKEPKLLEESLRRMDLQKINYGINLIVSSSNPYWQKQLEIIAASQCRFVITSLGNPQQVIQLCRPKNIAVFCDVTDLHFAKKVAGMKADALVAVNSGAGGHLSTIPASVLVPLLKKECNLPVISAGGVGTGSGFLSMLAIGADGLSIGSPFLATREAPISSEYKQACIKYGASDIVTSTKISGTPCTVINTPYVKKIGTKQSWFERLLSKHKNLKKYIRMLTYYRGMKLIEKAAFQATYQTVWCAGPSIEFTQEEKGVAEIIQQMIDEVSTAQKDLNKKFSQS